MGQVTKGQILCDFTYIRYWNRQIYRDKVEWWAWEEGRMGSYFLMDTEFQMEKMKKF